MRRRRSPASPAPEVDELRARLEEAEETLAAIRSGTVDALVIAGPAGERLFTLEGADYRYRRLVETMKEGAAIVTDGGAVVYGNQRLAEMLGTRLERLIGSRIDAYVAKAAQKTFQALLREGVTRSAKAEIVFLRSEVSVPTYVSVTPTGDDDGGVCLVVTDLTEQKRSEEILVAERLATSILEQAAEAVVVCSLDGRIVRASRAAHRLAGQNPLLRDFGGVFPIRLGDGTDHAALLSRVLAGEVVSGAEATLAGGGHGTQHLVVSAAPLANTKQETIGCVVSLTDVTERKRAEDGMQLLGRASVALGGSFNLRDMIDALVAVVVPSFADACAIYLLGDDRQALELAAAAHVDEARTSLLASDLAAVTRTVEGSLLEIALSAGTPTRIETLSGERDPSAKGAVVAVFRAHGVRSLMAAPLRAHRRTFGAILVGRTDSEDAFREEGLELLSEIAIRAAVAIDNSKLFDLAQREKERVQEANRAKDEFLAAVSHELRTPLNAILGWARMLRTHELPEDKRERALETIERNASIQAQLIDDLLDISRIVSGKLRLEQRDVDIIAVVQAAMDSVKPAAQAKDVSLSSHLDVRPAPVLGDPDRLQQVVWNLLTNAVKFTPPGGRVNVALHATSSHVDVEVTDDGRGISKEFLPHVFERFRQAEAGSTRAHGGLGIGLTIVKNLVELHGGTIAAYSDGEGHGARFVVHLPCIEAARTDRGVVGREPMKSFGCADELAGARFLVVDDDADGRDLVAEVLRVCKADVRQAENAADAYALLQKERFDALLSDISMPGEDGYTLIGRVRALPAEENGRIPAIALTAYARGEDRRRALLAGFDGHIPKPVEPHELVLVLANMIRRGGGLSGCRATPGCRPRGSARTRRCAGSTPTARRCRSASVRRACLPALGSVPTWRSRPAPRRARDRASWWRASRGPTSRASSDRG
jgi:PAS domain S-box-containing protein